MCLASSGCARVTHVLLPQLLANPWRASRLASLGALCFGLPVDWAEKEDGESIQAGVWGRPANELISSQRMAWAIRSAVGGWQEA